MKIHRSICVILLSVCLRVFCNPTTWIDSLMRRIKTDTSIYQVALISNSDDSSMSSPIVDDLVTRIVGTFATAQIDVGGSGLLHENEYTVPWGLHSEIVRNMATDTSTTFFVLVHRSRKAPNVLSSSLKTIDVARFISAFKTRPLILFVLCSDAPNNSSSSSSSSIKDFLNYIWTIGLIDFTIIELPTDFSSHQKISISWKEPSPIIHQLNPFKKTYTRVNWTPSIEWFPDKTDDLRGHRLNIGVARIPPFTMMDTDDDNQPINVRGANAEVVRMFAHQLNFTISFVNLDVMVDETQGPRNLRLYHVMRSGKVDLLCYLSSHHTPSQYRILRTQTVKIDRLCPVVPILPLAKIPLSENVLKAYVISFGIVAVFWMASHVLRFQGHMWQPFGLARVLFGISATRQPEMMSQRSLYACMLFLSAVFSSEIYSAVTDISLQTNGEMEFNTFEDLDKSGLAPVIHVYLFNKTFDHPDATLESLRDRVDHTSPPMMMAKCPEYAARHKNVTCLMMSDEARTVLRLQTDLEAKIAKPCFWSDNTAFLLAEGSPFRWSINGVIRHLYGSGLIAKVYGTREQPLSSALSSDKRDNTKALRNQILAIVVVGLLASMIVFVAEIVVHRVSRLVNSWGKFGSVKEFIFLGNDVIAMASGIHVLFLNIVTQEQRMERFDSKERGRGASCLAGHSVVPMFATAERRSHPKIFIFTYPGIRKISTCTPEKSPNGYLSSAFAGTDYLLTLTDFPNFQIILWLWRTGECLTAIDTKIADHDQHISCSPSSPYLLSQIGKSTGELMVYEIGVCSKIVSIVPVGGASTLKTKTVSTSWTEDGNLLHCDYVGNVTLISSDGKICFLVVKGEDDALTSDKSPLIEAFRTGVVLVNKKSKISFYRKITGSNRVKSASPWKSVWSVQATSHPTWIARCQFKDRLLLCTDRREIFELGIDGEDDSPRLRVICNLGSNYEFLTSVNRLGSHVAAVDRCQRLDIIQCVTGQLEGNLCLKNYGQVRCVVSHPTDAIIAIGTITGKCVLVNLANISEPSVSNVTHLQREPLDMIRYSWFGDILGVAAIQQSKLFIIDPSKEKSSVVLGFIHLSIEIIDFLIYDTDKGSSKILVLIKTSKTHRCGRKMIIYSFDYANNTEECERIIQFPSMLNVLNYGRSKDEIITVPYLTKQLHFLKIQKDFEGLNVTEVIRSGHQLRNIRININNSFVVTCSFDGLVIVRSKEKIHQVLAIFMAHHRQEGGAKYTIFSGEKNTIVSLGRNGDLTATNIRCLEVVSDVSEGERSAICCQTYKEAIVEDNLTWMERTLAMNFQEELEKCVAERFSILQHFENLQKKLKLLLDTNDVESPNARIPISDFDLDQVSRSQKLHDNIAFQKDLLSKLEKEILQQDKVASYLRKLCWDCMEVPSCSLLSISGKTIVDNFPICRSSKFQNDCHKWETFSAEFKPSDNRNNQSNQELSKSFLIMGTTTHRWLPKIPPLLSNQIKKFTNFVEGRKLCIMIRDQEKKLKIRFNKIFEDMLVVKERELAVAAERIDEIRHCASELKNTFGVEPPKANGMLQPLWHYSEKPQTIVTVTDDEISSGSAVIFLERDLRQEIIKKQESEHLKLNDNFREAALEAMMDGLLEVRWEDDIKKGPPKPLCLSTKDPSNYTEDEIAAVEMYQRKYEQLKVEREKYKKIIEDKISKVQEALRRDAKAFDRSLATFYLERMNIESAVFQEMLMHLRELQRHSMRRRGMEMMLLASNELESASKEFRNLAKISTVLETAVNDTRNRYDNLTKRDRLLEGKLRSEFPDLKQPMVEHLLRQYRKRPRNVQFTCTSITFLTEIARCLVSGEKSGILPRDCLEFLRGINSLDVMPNNLPTQIDSSHWQHLCKLRRAKIELEIKIKSCAVDLAQAEQTFVLHQKSCTNAEVQLLQMKEKMKERELEHLRILEDMQVQLVLKMGQIECRLRGDPSELSNAVLVPFETVDRANDAIIQAGRKKIIAMRKTVQFRRTTLWQEWSHTCLRITLQDMKDELKLLQGVKITKELQNYLQSHSRSVGEEKEIKKYEKIVTSTKKRFQRMLQEKKRQLIETGDKVTAWRKQNKRLGNAVKRTKLASFKASMVALDGSRTRDFGHRRAKLIAIMKRTRLMKKIQDNYGELQALQTQLELFRLKTYPTLRLKGLAKYKTTNKTNRP